MSPTAEATAPELRWTLGLRPSIPAAALGLSLLLAASYAGLAALFGIPVLGLGPGDDPRFAGNAFSALLVSALLGLCLAAPEFYLRRNGDDVAALAPLLPDRDGERARREWLARTLAPVGLARATALGAALGLATWSVPLVRHVLPDPTPATVFASLWFLATVPLLYVVSLRAAHLTARGMLCLPVDLEIDVFDQRALAPFARIGLRNALLWVVAATLLLGMVFSIPLSDLWTAMPAFVGIVLLAAAALAGPILRARAVIRREKARELERSRRELREAMEALRRGEDPPSAAARIQGLAAWRAAVVDAHEWPVDAPTLVRFLLYLVIPVLGWLAAALVERGVDRLLG